MILDFFANRVYGNKSIQRMQQLFVEPLGDQKGNETCAAMATIMRADLKQQGMKVDALMKAYRKKGLSHDEAAISAIDGTVGSMRRMAQHMVAMRQSGRKVEADQERGLNNIIASCEKVLDGWAKAGHRRIVPRHGRFGEAATMHMGEFLTP